MLHAAAGQVRGAYRALHEAMLVVAHHLLELQGSRGREIEVGHLVNKAAFVGGNHSQHSADGAMAEYQVHAFPYFASRVRMAAMFWKFSGTISTPEIEIPCALSRSETSVMMSKESSILSARKSCDVAKSNSGRISLRIASMLVNVALPLCRS